MKTAVIAEVCLLLCFPVCDQILRDLVGGDGDRFIDLFLRQLRHAVDDVSGPLGRQDHQRISAVRFGPNRIYGWV